MKTLLLNPDAIGIKTAASLLNSGQLIGMPTETVYGLAADALNTDAVAEIFKIKRRAPDNPLIIHISSTLELEHYCLDIPDSAFILAEKFWPGPLTLLLKRKSLIPDIVTAGLDTVAVRCPAHETALRIIHQAQCPVAAPSANISGKISPTKSSHVFSDLNGRIPAVVDGGDCLYGLESTIVDLSTTKPVILRPGSVSIDDLRLCIADIGIDKSVLNQLETFELIKSPGIKYKHYAPDANLILLRGDLVTSANYVNGRTCEHAAVLCFDGECKYFNCTALSYGAESDYSAQARNLFSTLRELDEKNVDVIYARVSSNTSGIALAVANRLLKASSFTVIDL